MPPKYTALELPNELTSSPSRIRVRAGSLGIEPHIACDPGHIRTKTLPLGRVLSIRSGCEKAARVSAGVRRVGVEGRGFLNRWPALWERPGRVFRRLP